MLQNVTSLSLHTHHISDWENPQRQELQCYCIKLILDRCKEKKVNVIYFTRVNW